MTGRTPLEDVGFLARSPHRVRVLDALADGVRTRGAIHERTGISQPTLGRALGAFQDRGWIEKQGQEFSFTPFGRVLAEEFGDLLDTIGTMYRLRELVPHLPVDGLPFGLHELADATVTMPRQDDSFAHLSRTQRLLAEAETFRLLAPSIYPPAFRDLHERLQVRDLVTEVVFSMSALETLRADPELAPLARDVLASEGSHVYGYDGPVPYVLGLVDGRALFLPLDELSVPVAVIESTNEAVVSWVGGKIDEYRDGSTAITVEDFFE